MDFWGGRGSVVKACELQDLDLSPGTMTILLSDLIQTA